jgi:hypothetical protein
MVYTQTARPGSRAPHAWLQPGLSTLDLYGRDFVLMRFDPKLPVDALVAAAAGVGLPVTVHTCANAALHALYGAPLVLVRPDGMVAWRGAAVPDDAGALIDKVRGAARGETAAAAATKVPQDLRTGAK